MIASGAVFVPLLHPHRRVTRHHAAADDFAGALSQSLSQRATLAGEGPRMTNPYLTDHNKLEVALKQ